MPSIDEYVTDVLMRDLVGHDKRPVSFLVYLWLSAEQQRRNSPVRISYQELAESIGVSKSSAQTAVGWLVRRELLQASKANATATPVYKVQRPWRTRRQELLKGLSACCRILARGSRVRSGNPTDRPWSVGRRSRFWDLRTGVTPLFLAYMSAPIPHFISLEMRNVIHRVRLIGFVSGVRRWASIATRHVVVVIHVAAEVAGP